MKNSRRWTFVILLALTVGAFVLRAYDLSAAGLSEDEVHKVEAARAYLRGDFSQNLEHPMLMKLQIAACLAATDAWNAHFEGVAAIPEEVPVRLPNALAGALTTIVLFLFADLMFGAEVGLATAAFWATGVMAIAINRVAKEDSLLVLFFWLCLYFYECAKRYGASHVPAQSRLYGVAGACLGLMLASKYFPHYWGLIFLFYHFVGRNETNQPLTRRDFVWFYGGFALLFLALNPTVLLPSTLRYFIAYTEEETVTHHGYLLMGRIFPNNFSATPGGLPIYFYPLLLAIKTPLAILAASLCGVVIAVRRRRETAYLFLVFMFVLWIVPYSVFAAKWLRYILSLLPIVYMCAAVGAVDLVRSIARQASAQKRRTLRAVAAGALSVSLVALPTASAIAGSPFYSLYMNSLGMGRTGYFFPHDEFYDAGMREAIAFVCREAPRGALIYGEAPPVFDYYTRKFGRTDLRFVATSAPEARSDVNAPDYVIVQTGRLYFENERYIREIEASHQPAVTIRVAGAVASRVYRLGEPAGRDGAP